MRSLGSGHTPTEMRTHLQPLLLSNLHHAPPNHLLGGAREFQLQAVILQ